MLIFKQAIIVALILLLLPIRATAAIQREGQVADVVRGEVATALDGYLSGLEKQGFAGAVLLTKGDSILLRKGYGFADCKHSRKVAPNMIFDIGSITKTITAVAILKLQELGKLNIEDPMSRVLEGVPPDKSAITIKHLLMHESGLEDSFGNDEDFVTKDWLVKRALDSKLLSRPGERESYSNVGYSLLGAIIEKVSSKTYEAFVSEQILKPAQLTQTGYILPKWNERLVVCGSLKGKPWGSVKDYYGKGGPSWHLMANGGMLSTVTELDKWFSALLENRILPESLTNSYLQATVQLTPRGTRAIATSGANNIFSSQFVKWLDDDVTLVLFTSNSEWPKEKVSPTLMQEIKKLMVSR